MEEAQKPKKLLYLLKEIGKWSLLSIIMLLIVAILIVFGKKGNNAPFIYRFF